MKMAFLTQDMKFGNHDEVIDMAYKVISRNDFDYITDMNGMIKAIHRKADNIFVYPSGKIITNPVERDTFQYVLKHFKNE